MTAWKDERSGIIMITEGAKPKITFFDVSPPGTNKLERTKCEWKEFEKLKEALINE